MVRSIVLLLSIAVITATVGCAPVIIPIGSHVTKTGPETSVDDIWVLHGGVLKRCSNTPQGPTCVAVQNH